MKLAVVFKAILGSGGLDVLVAIIMYYVGLGLSMILHSSAVGTLNSAHLLQQFGYTYASKLITTQGIDELYQSQAIPYILSLTGTAIAAVIEHLEEKEKNCIKITSKLMIDGSIFGFNIGHLLGIPVGLSEIYQGYTFSELYQDLYNETGVSAYAHLAKIMQINSNSLAMSIVVGFGIIGVIFGLLGGIEAALELCRKYNE